MVQPERLPGEETRQTRAPRAAFLVATVVFVIAAAFGLGRLTAPSSETAVSASTTTTEPPLFRPTTTTTIDLDDFRVADVAAGRPVRWVRGSGIGTGEPVSLVDHDGDLQLFARRQPAGGLHLWTTDEGVFWLDQGEVIGPEYVVDEVVSSGGQLLALGREEATGSAAIFTSADGLAWRAELLPAPRELLPGERLVEQHVLAHADITLVFAMLEGDPIEKVYQYLPDDVAAVAREHGLSWDGPPYRFRVHGPWGMTGHVATAEELGVPDDVMAGLNWDWQPEIYVWRSTPVDGWEVAEFDADWIENAIIDDGTFIVYGHGPFRAMTWTSKDGSTWEATNNSRELFSVVQGPTGLAGIDHISFTPDISTSQDGIEWSRTGLIELLPSALDWDLEWLAGSDSGLAVLARAFRPTSDATFAWPTASLQRDGYEMTFDLETAVVSITDAETGSDVLRFSVEGERPTPGVEVDFASRTVTVLDDPDDGDPLVTFGFDEMLAAERAAWVTTFSDMPDFEAFLFSSNGEDWTIQDMADVMVGDLITELLVTGDRIIAISADRLSYGARGESFRTWLGMVPSG